jgi:hypothetical protein
LAAMLTLFTFGPTVPFTLIRKGEEFPPFRATESIRIPLSFVLKILMNLVTEPVVVNTVSKCTVSVNTDSRTSELLVKDSFLHEKTKANKITKTVILTPQSYEVVYCLRVIVYGFHN